MGENKDIVDEVKALDTDNNDLIILKVNKNISEDTVNKIYSIFSDLDINSELLIMSDECEIETLSEEEMEKAGWVKKEVVSQ